VFFPSLPNDGPKALRGKDCRLLDPGTQSTPRRSSRARKTGREVAVSWSKTPVPQQIHFFARILRPETKAFPARM
jgi:hypothetical protein